MQNQKHIRILNRVWQRTKMIRFVLIILVISLVAQSSTAIAQNLRPTEAVQKNPKKLDFSHIGETTFKLNVRKSPSLNSQIVGELPFYEQVNYSEYNYNWLAIEYENEIAYIKKQYVEELVLKTSKGAWNDRRKSYLDYRKITSKTSRQYKLQKMAYTSKDGYRMVGNRYCIALGSYYTTSIGTYVDLVLENGEVIPCILGECKADDNTMDNHTKGTDGSVSEFVVDEDIIRQRDTEEEGNCSELNEGWDSPVVEIKIYQKNALEL